MVSLLFFFPYPGIFYQASLLGFLCRWIHYFDIMKHPSTYPLSVRSVEQVIPFQFNTPLTGRNRSSFYGAYQTICPPIFWSLSYLFPIHWLLVYKRQRPPPTNLPGAVFWESPIIFSTSLLLPLLLDCFFIAFSHSLCPVFHLKPSWWSLQCSSWSKCGATPLLPELLHSADLHPRRHSNPSNTFFVASCSVPESHFPFSTFTFNRKNRWKHTCAPTSSLHFPEPCCLLRSLWGCFWQYHLSYYMEQQEGITVSES